MAQPTTEQLATPTIGAWQRANGRGMSLEARQLLAVTYIQEWQRVVLLQRLDSIQRFLVAGATPDQAAARIAQLAADYYGAHT